MKKVYRSLIYFIPFLLFAQLRVHPEEYIVGPGDLLEILVKGKTSFSYMTRIDLQGKIDISGIFAEKTLTSFKKGQQGTVTGEIGAAEKIAYLEVAGMTLKELKDTLNSYYKNIFPGAEVDIRLLEARVFNLPVLGEVVNPGNYPATPLMRVSDMIESAGGFKPGASMSEIIVEEESGKIKVDLYSYFFKGNKKMNPFLGKALSIYVPRAKKTVRVKGAIRGHLFFQTPKQVKSREAKTSSQTLLPREGKIDEVLCEFKEGDRVLDAVNKAGGLTESADLKRITIIRNGKTLKEVSLDTALRPGDIIYIPSLPQYVYVVGEVENPGPYDFEPGMSYMDFISMAGGFTERAKSNGIYIVRKGKKIRANEAGEVERGDIIVVPRVIVKFWEDYVKIISVATTILVTWLTLKR